MNGFGKNKNRDVNGDLNGLMSDYLLRKRQTAILPYLDGKEKVLDVGCGIFRWQGLLPSDIEYVGIDCEKSMIEHNREHFTHKFFVVNLNLNNLQGVGKNFDLIILSAVIEHLDKPEAVIKKLALLLRSNGTIVLTTPHPMGNLILNFGAKIGIFSKDKHQHHDLLNRQRINEIANANNLKLARYKRFLYGFNQLSVLKKKNIYKLKNFVNHVQYFFICSRYTNFLDADKN